MASKTELLNLKKYVYSVKTFVNSVSLLNSSNDVFLSFYLLALLLSVIWMIWLMLKKLSFPIVKTHELLYEAVVKGDNIKAIRIMEGNPATIINMYNKSEGYTPFLKACMIGNIQLVRYMLAAGADISMKSLRNETAFYLAIYYHIKHPEIKDASCIHALYYAGIDINAVNEKGYNALQMACSYGHTSLVKWLMEKGADSNVLPDPYILAKIQGHAYTALVFENLRCKQKSSNRKL